MTVKLPICPVGFLIVLAAAASRSCIAQEPGISAEDAEAAMYSHGEAIESAEVTGTESITMRDDNQFMQSFGT